MPTELETELRSIVREFQYAAVQAGLSSSIDFRAVMHRSNKVTLSDRPTSPEAPKYEDLEDKVVRWARDRGIIQNSTATSQYLKAASEMGELADAIAKDDHLGLVDAVGDTVVCLINLCEIKGTTLVDCLNVAYETIKDRKGKMLPGGVFVKEEK